MCFFRFETQWNPFPRHPHSWTTLQCHIRHHIHWNPFMQNPQIWTILWPISCPSRNTISTDILSSRNHQILKLLKSPHAASTNNNQSLILLMCFIHKNGPVPYLSQFLHQILNAPKIFSCSIHNYEPLSYLLQVLHQILYSAESPHISSINMNHSHNPFLWSYASSDTKSMDIVSCSIHKHEPFPDFAHVLPLIIYPLKYFHTLEPDFITSD